MFADDIKIIWRSQGLEEKKLMYDNIQCLSDWSIDWSVQFNPNKSGALKIWNDFSTLYTLNDLEIVLSSSFKNLERIITTESDLSCSPHHRSMIAEAYKSLGHIC